MNFAVSFAAISVPLGVVAIVVGINTIVEGDDRGMLLVLGGIMLWVLLPFLGSLL